MSGAGQHRGSAVARRGELVAGRYRLEEPIARGGMAEVWAAHDDTLDRRVAVKILHAHLADDAGFVSRFRREALAIAKLSHANVVAVYDTGLDHPRASQGDDRTRAYIVMELVRGSSVRALLQRGVTVPDAVSIAVGAADGLSYAHRHGLVHRDIKPANILVQPDGQVKVVDFGIAKVAQGSDRTNEDLTQAGAILGTAKYLAPEQVEGHPVDARTDVYALGVVLYEMLCGQPPFSGANDLATALHHVRSTPIPPRQLRPGIPRSVEAVVLKAMAREPGERFPSAADMAKALRSIDLSDSDTIAQTSRGPDDRTPPAGTATLVRPPAADANRARPGRDTTVLERPVKDPAGAEGRDLAPRRRRFGLAGVTAALLGITGGLGAGIIAATASHSRTAGSPLAVVGWDSFDPLGSNGENDSLLARLFDGNRSTAWTTEPYGTRTFNDRKPGVGVVFRVDGPAVRRLRILSPSRGWTARVYSATSEGRTLDSWGGAVAEVGPITAGTTDVALRGARGQYVLLWITDLGPTSTPPARVVISEISPRG